MKKYNDFVLEQSAKFVNVDYKIILRDLKDNPKTLITDFKIVKTESGKSEIKAKGYTKVDVDGYSPKKKQVWVPFDDFENDKTRTVWNKNFENGSKKIKVVL
jgi:hypothetical protein